MTTEAPGYSPRKDNYAKRLRRIEGQVRGIAKMIDEDKYCIDVLTQISAVNSALRSVALNLLDEHLVHCVSGAVAMRRRGGRRETHRSLGRYRAVSSLLTRAPLPCDPAVTGSAMRHTPLDAAPHHMTVETGNARLRPWTPQTTARLAILSAAAFIYATAEILPVGALPAISVGLNVSEALVGTLLAWYAVVAAATTLPLVRWTAFWPRRRVLLLTLVCLTTSQVISAMAPNFAVLAVSRALCAVTHGLMWSVLAPIATRLVPPSHSGRATTAIYVGTSLALVVGIPLTSAMSLLWGWRLAVVVITVAAAAITLAARLALLSPGAQHGPTGPGREPSPPQRATGRGEHADADRGRRALHLLHLHRGDHR